MKFKRILYLDHSDTIYTKAIKRELHNVCVEVDCFFYDEILSFPIFHRYKNSKKDLMYFKQERISQFINYLKYLHYDVIFVKQPQDMPVKFFEYIKEIFPNTPIINYNWSSLDKFNILPYKDLFSEIFSFDYTDCRLHSFNYLPLFYLKDFENISNKFNHKIYRLSFVGSGYSIGRLDFLEKVIQKEKEHLKKMFIYIYTPGKMKSLRLLIKRQQLAKYCYWKYLNINGVLNVFAQSEAMIDHPMKIQTGLTMRTFETLASGLHLYTTNKYIRQEPFYSEERVTVINENLDGFTCCRKPNSGNDSYIDSFQDYRIDNWLRKILSSAI